MRAFLIDSLGLLDRKWDDNTCRRYCDELVRLHGEGHEWISGFIDALLHEAQTGAAVDRAILETRRDAIVAKIRAIYAGAAAREGSGDA